MSICAMEDVNGHIGRIVHILHILHSKLDLILVAVARAALNTAAARIARSAILSANFRFWEAISGLVE